MTSNPGRAGTLYAFALLLEAYRLIVRADWPYCNAAKRLSSVVMTNTDWSSWDKLQWRRRLETFGDNDASILASGPDGEIDTVWYNVRITK